MPRVIAVTNFKGGIGKTTTTVNVAAGFAIKGASVLVIDVDPQSNVRMCFGHAEPRRSLYDVLIDNKKIPDCVVQVRPNIDLLASSDALLQAQSDIGKRPDWGRVLENALRPVVRNYDFVLIDCSASLTVLNLNALMAASDIIVPTALEHLALQGLRQLGRNITRIKGTMGALRMIIPTMFDGRNRQSHRLLASLREEYGTLVTDPVRVNVRLSEATAEGKTIYEYDPRSNGAIDYAALVEKLSEVFNFQAKPMPEQVAQPVNNGLPNPARTAAPVEIPPPPQPALVSNLQAEEKPNFRGPVREECPHCGRPLEQVMLAGYRVYFCDHCKYKRQELASGVRR
ncbi:AAA family ATPase [Herpetosiphon giganteus]|uniref:AAA family ATPase n=1 Tax=Herpetosiphon giganteus TaxID=2029754 RepID=UPI00195F0CBB|nr:AAA family ATPase [Herpetosiphon giganteus]MBM7844067.1 chromosome partitioning protein [Herpetosiphon giganteus]